MDSTDRSSPSGCHDVYGVSHQAHRKLQPLARTNTDGTPTSEVDNLRQALRPLRKLYEETPAADFGPKSLKAVRGEMIRALWAQVQALTARVAEL